MTRTEAQQKNFERQQAAQAAQERAAQDRRAAFKAGDDDAWQAAQDRFDAATADWQAATKEAAETRW